jgi:asparaginyl-tRNA synthetase
MKRLKIKDLLSHDTQKTHLNHSITVFGWVKTVRQQKTFSFIELNDGSSIGSLQLLLSSDLPDYEKLLTEITTGCSISAYGILQESPGHKQHAELKVENLLILGSCPADTYPLQKKRHSFEFLRTIAHLRPRTNTQGAVARIRSTLAIATHQFFKNHGFIYVQTPIITGSDCEGAGELFQVTTLPLEKLPKTADGQIDYAQDFFAKAAFLTVSGQLNGEAYASALSDIYTFGPTFRAENSNTSRHLAEFWMIEPEIAFANLNDDMILAESYVKFLVETVLNECSDDLKFCDEWIEKGLLDRLKHVVKEPFAKVTYTEALEILKKSGKKFDFPYHFGADLQSEHECYLADEHFKKPVFLYNYPKSLKAFYMRDNDDGITVAAMDLLVPKIGELIGGSQREERLERLIQKMEERNLDTKTYDWYLDLRRFGSVPHAGFGLGFERLVRFCTGIENIRDVNAFPRYPSHAEF